MADETQADPAREMDQKRPAVRSPRKRSLNIVQPMDLPGQEFHTPRQETFIPISGFVKLSDAEIDIVNHPAVQRLGRIHQLGQVHLIFRGATHTRLEHSIGTLHMVSTMAIAIAENHARRRIDSDAEPPCADISPLELAFIRLAALLHDVGHVPSGHTLEDELHLIRRHDSRGRLEMIFDRTHWLSSPAKSLREVVDDSYAFWMPNDNEQVLLTPSNLLLAILAPNSGEAATINHPAGFRVDVCRDLVADTICADILDYLQRDWYHIGKPRHFEDRLLQYMEIQPQAIYEDEPLAASVTAPILPSRTSSRRPSAIAHRDAFVISLGSRPRLRVDAVSAILELLDLRYQLSEIVLFHRSKLSLAAMLERAIQELRVVAGKDASSWMSHLEEQLLDESDDGLLRLLHTTATELEATTTTVPIVSNPDAARAAAAARKLVDDLRGRRLYDELVTRYYEEFPSDVVSRLADLYTNPVDGAQVRMEALTNLEIDFGLPRGSIVVYFPRAAMNAKIAKVRISVDNQVAPFDAWEGRGNTISGGHLLAQQQRFIRLWRVHFFIAKEVTLSDARHDLLKDTIIKLLLSKHSGRRILRQRAAGLAERATKTAGMPQYGDKLAEAARGSSPGPSYPTGSPCLRSLTTKN